MAVFGYPGIISNHLPPHLLLTRALQLRIVTVAEGVGGRVLLNHIIDVIEESGVAEPEA